MLQALKTNTIMKPPQCWFPFYKRIASKTIPKVCWNTNRQHYTQHQQATCNLPQSDRSWNCY